MECQDLNATKHLSEYSKELCLSFLGIVMLNGILENSSIDLIQLLFRPSVSAMTVKQQRYPSFRETSAFANETTCSSCPDEETA